MFQRKHRFADICFILLTDAETRLQLEVALAQGNSQSFWFAACPVGPVSCGIPGWAMVGLAAMGSLGSDPETFGLKAWLEGPETGHRNQAKREPKTSASLIRQTSFGC